MSTEEVELLTVAFQTGAKQVRDMDRAELVETIRLLHGESKMWLKEAKESLRWAALLSKGGRG